MQKIKYDYRKTVLVLKKLYIPFIICFLLFFVACHSNPADTTVNSTQVTTSTTAKASHTAIENFVFEETNGNISITQYIGSDKQVVIPERINNKAVTHIASASFLRNKDIVSVTLPNTVTSIGTYAFRDCESLTTVTLSENLEKIDGSAFENCAKLTDIILPKSLKQISSKAFSNCRSLKQIAIFKNCTIGPEAFYNSGLENITFETGVTQIPDTGFAGTNIQTLVLPNTVQTIGRQAFAGCQKLSVVSLSEGLKTVGDLAFYNTNLKEIIIPSTVTQIKESSFGNCANLDKIKFEGNAPDNFLRLLQDQHLKPENVHFTIFYHKTASGFTSPEWNGYPSEIW